MMTHEEATIRAFLLPAKRARFMALLKQPKQRPKLRNALAHFHFFDARFIREIPPSRQTLPLIVATLRSLGASNRCHLISEDTRFDGRDMDLDEALSNIIGQGFGTLLSCIPGRLAYFEGEEAGCRCILIR